MAMRDDSAMAIEFRPGRSDESPGREMMRELNDLFNEQYPGRAAKPGSVTSPDEMSPPGGAFLVGYEDGEPVASGGVRRFADGVCEIKRMYVVPAAQSHGVGRALLAALENAAWELGYATVRLDAGPAQTHSRALFEKTGYVEIPKYNENHIAVYFAEKQLEKPAQDVSDELERWLGGEGPRTLGGLIDTFGERSFAIVFALLMALPALPLPTGGATHVLEVITVLLSLELIAGRREIWLPQRWRRIELGGPARQKVITKLLACIRWLERYSRPRGRWLFGHRLSGIVFGLVTLGLTITAFLSPPFSGLDTLPSIGVVVLAVGVLLTDVVLATAGFVVGALGVVATIGFGSLVVKAMRGLF
jgi:GNAT superfamily N-acetyltransferase